MAIPDDTGPEDLGPDGTSGQPREPGPVSDADWDRVVEGLIGPAEARGTQDSFLEPAGPFAPRADRSLPDPGREGNEAAPWRGRWPSRGRAGTPVEAPGRGWIGAGLEAAAADSWRRLVARIDHWLRKRPASLTLPAGSQARFTIGREPACDMTLLDRTVSRWHASLQREDDGWLLTDLGSTNGTRLNGWRVKAPIAVSPGDQVSFGAATFVLTERPGRLR